MSAKKALKTFCDLYYASGLNTDWILVGSVASVLQGADMDPNDVDIYVKHEQDVKELSELMRDFCETTSINLTISNPAWRSSVEEPYRTQTSTSGFTWSKGRWTVHSFPLEVVHVSNSAGIPDSVHGDGIWEGGKYIWHYQKKIRFENYEISVVPLEIQLESNLRRKREDRVRSIIAALKQNGYDKELLKKAVAAKHHEVVHDLLS
jgi:hypothetical protein